MEKLKTLQHRRIMRMCSSSYMKVTYQRRSDMNWSRSSDGSFWSFEGEDEKHGWGEHSRREGSADKLVSLAVSSPACLAQSDTHFLWWSAGAYRIVDMVMRSAESRECSHECALNAANLALVSGRHLRQPVSRNCGRTPDLCEFLCHHSKTQHHSEIDCFLNARNLSQKTSLKLTATFKRLVLKLVITLL